MVKNLIPNQKVKVNYLADDSAAIKCLQNNKYPGIFILKNTKPKANYIINFKGYKLTNAPIDIWICNINRKIIQRWDNVINRTLTKLKLSYQSGFETRLYIGVMFANPIINDTIVINQLDFDEVGSIKKEEIAASESIKLKNVNLIVKTPLVAMKTTTEAKINKDKTTEAEINKDKTTIAIIIYTYDRYEMLQNLLNSIKKNLPVDQLLDVFIFDDASPGEQIYQSVDYPFTIHYHKFSKNHGRYKWYKMIDYIYRFFKNKIYNNYIFTSDDMVFVQGGINSAIRLYSEIDDQSKICLNLNNDRGPDSKWTTKTHKNYNHDMWKVYWVDMCFVCNYNFLQAVNFEIDFDLFSSMTKHKKYSSGVGRYLSLTLHEKKYNLYLVKKSLVKHLGNINSKMNPRERKLHKLISRT